METTGLILAVSQAAVQLAGVIKRHVFSLSTLEHLASSVQSKAARSSAVARKLCSLATLSELGSELFTHTLQDLRVLVNELSAAEKEIRRWNQKGILILQAPVIEKSLNAIDSKLTQIDHHFRTVGVLGSLISAHHTEIREMALSALAIILSPTDETLRRKVLLDLEARLQTRTPHTNDIARDAEFAFIMGLASYDSKPEKLVLDSTPTHRIKSAARYFKKACDLGKKEAFRYLGDIYFDGKAIQRSYRKAVDLYEQGVARDDCGAMYALGICYEFGHGVAESVNQSLHLLEKAIDGGSGEAMAELGYLKLHGTISRANHSEAARLLKKAANLNVFSAKQSLPICYQFGIGVDADARLAFKLYKEGFHGGILLSTFRLANCHDTGFGVEMDPNKATKIYEECMRKGTWERDFFGGYYGLRMVLGYGVKKNVSLGKKIIMQSTKSNSAYGWHALGECYRYGVGFKQNINRARASYLKAVSCASGDGGILDSYLALASMFENGMGVQVDTKQAYSYYLEAANRLSPEAQWKVAVAFENGIGVVDNVYRAVFYFKLCANSGNHRAQQKYTKYYMKGHGVERNRIDSRRVIEDAAREGSKDAKRLLKRECLGCFGNLFRSRSI